MAQLRHHHTVVHRVRCVSTPTPVDLYPPVPVHHDTVPVALWACTGVMAGAPCVVPTRTRSPRSRMFADGW